MYYSDIDIITVGNDKILLRIRIKGRVQGVGFRWNAAREANELGITGFVRNMPDGTVYIEAEGLRLNIEKFLEWCQAGPVFSSVHSVEYDKLPPHGYKTFSIKH